MITSHTQKKHGNWEYNNTVVLTLALSYQALHLACYTNNLIKNLFWSHYITTAQLAIGCNAQGYGTLSETAVGWTCTFTVLHLG